MIKFAHNERISFMPKGYFQGESVASDRLLYTPSEFARSNLLYLQEIGHLRALKPHTSRRQNLASFLFFRVKSGSGVLGYGGQEYTLHAGDCVFIHCKEPYFHRTGDDLWTLEWVHFYGETMLPIYAKYLERGGRPVIRPEELTDGTRQNERSKAEAIWSDLNAIAYSSDYIRDIRINEALSSLLSFLMSYSWDPKLGEVSNAAKAGTADIRLRDKARQMASVKEYLDGHYAEKIALDQLSELFFLNKYSLARDFKEFYGTSVINYLLTVRITHAKQMLRFTNLSVDEIGASCGITPLYYFSRAFKKIEGISPSEYRRHWT